MFFCHLSSTFALFSDKACCFRQSECLLHVYRNIITCIKLHVNCMSSVKNENHRKLHFEHFNVPSMSIYVMFFTLFWWRTGWSSNPGNNTCKAYIWKLKNGIPVVDRSLVKSVTSVWSSAKAKTNNKAVNKTVHSYTLFLSNMSCLILYIVNWKNIGF